MQNINYYSIICNKIGYATSILRVLLSDMASLQAIK